ncbi:DUF1775 domain-containing protein [Paractinoplanes ferrugineus]|nr:DUF1775 domain-containing protein [Actinoplanes ferrugineus]
MVTVGAVAGFAVFGVAGPALAHVEVSADKTTAGAENVTLTFDGEAESTSAGLAAERVVLPAGIDPAGVTLVSAPAGWAFSRTADGFTVAGKALKVGTDAVWKVKIAKLPDGETRLSFKTLETYGDGKVSRWIEIQQAGQDEPDNPAPLVTLKPGPSSAPAAAAGTPAATAPVAIASATSSDAAVAPPASPTPSAVAGDRALQRTAEDQGSTWWIWAIIAVVLAAIAGFAVLRQRRSARPAEPRS